MGIWLAGWLVDPVMMMENLLFMRASAGPLSSTIVASAAFTWKNVKSVPFLIFYTIVLLIPVLWTVFSCEISISFSFSPCLQSPLQVHH